MKKVTLTRPAYVGKWKPEEKKTSVEAASLNPDERSESPIPDSSNFYLRGVVEGDSIGGPPNNPGFAIARDAAARDAAVRGGTYTRERVRRKTHVDSKVSRGDTSTSTSHVDKQPVSSGDTDDKVSTLLAAAKHLTVKQRQELLDNLALACQMKDDKQNRDIDMWSESVSIALAEKMGPDESYGVYLVRKLLGVSTVWRPVMDFMKSSKLQQLKVVERQSVYLMLAKLLVDYAERVSERSGAPLGPKLIGSCAVHLPGVFDREFPGYLACGLAPLVAKQMQAVR